MVGIRKPYGAIAESLLADAFELKGKYYIIDVVGNKFETTKEEYEKSVRLLGK